MQSRTVHLDRGPASSDALREVSAAAGRDPDVVLAFLSPERDLPGTLAAMAAAWPESLRFGCEAVTQFADGELTTSGTIQLFWFAHPGHGAAVEVVAGTHEEPPSAQRLDELARRLEGADGVLLLVDGLRFPAEALLAELRQRLGPAMPLAAGGLASQQEPVRQPGARVFLQEEVLPSACLAVALSGVRMAVEVVRGWDPASPVYTVTRAAGNVVHEIDGEPATQWYRRFFSVQGHLAPMPQSAYRFPLIIEGPSPDRQGLYRSMRFFDLPPRAVTYWGSVQEGDQVRLGMGNDVSLARTAGSLPRSLAPEAAILYSCVGRELVLGDMAGDEPAAVHRALEGASLSGFFTFGEIGPSARGGPAFYNQTAILVLLHEVEA